MKMYITEFSGGKKKPSDTKLERSWITGYQLGYQHHPCMEEERISESSQGERGKKTNTCVVWKGYWKLPMLLLSFRHKIALSYHFKQCLKKNNVKQDMIFLTY